MSKRTYYSTDGVGKNVWNKSSFPNLQAYEDLGIPTEWHVYGASHDKCACDGIGANIKRLAARSAKYHIVTPQTLFQWAKRYGKENEIFNRKESHSSATEILEGRFDQAATIPGTLQYHASIPLRIKNFK